MFGVDIVDIERFRKMKDKKYFELFARRIESNVEHCKGNSFGDEDLARIFAIKEAIIKASDNFISLGDMGLIKLSLVPGSLNIASYNNKEKLLEFLFSSSSSGYFVIAIAVMKL